MIATKIRFLNVTQLGILWNDGHDSPIALRTLRENCPCASCKGETVLLHTYEPVPTPERPGMFELKNAEQVGYYALQLHWGDGHATGIYTWELLRSLCECPECLPKRLTDVSR